MPYIKQLAYEGDLTIPEKKGELKRVPLSKEYFAALVNNFKEFKARNINVPVTKEHFSTKIEDTLGYVTALWEQPDTKGRNALYCAVEFDEEPTRTILNAGASIETSFAYPVVETGEVLFHCLKGVTVTPTPVIAGMEPFSLALSLGRDGVTPAAATTVLTMPEQLAALIFEFLGVDPTQYEGKETELLEFVAKSLAELRKTPETETQSPALESPAAENADKVGGSQAVEVETETKEEPQTEEQKQIAELTLSLNHYRQQTRLAKLEALAKEGKLSKPAYDKAKAMYGGNLALSRDAEFNDFCQVIAANTPVANMQSLTKLQTLPMNTVVNDPLAKVQEKKYGKKV